MEENETGVGRRASGGSGAGPMPQPQSEPPKSGPAIAALVLGIVAVVFCFVPIVNGLSLVCGIVGLVLALVAFSSVRKGKSSGRGLAVSGIVLNIVALAIVVLMMASCGAVVAGTGNYLASNAANSTASQSTAGESGEDGAGATAGGDATEDETGSQDQVSSSFKKKMDKYEKFFDRYVKVMKKYQDDPTDLSLAADVTSLAAEESDMLSEFQSIDASELSAADAAYYAEVSARITKKLSKVM